MEDELLDLVMEEALTGGSVDDYYPDDATDGDQASALASAGWVTSEDYGLCEDFSEWGA